MSGSSGRRNLLNQADDEPTWPQNLLNGARTFVGDITDPNPNTYYGTLMPVARDAGGDPRLGAPRLLQGLVGGAMRGFTAPGRALSGEMAPEEMNGDALNLALGIAGGRAAGPALPKAADELGRGYRAVDTVLSNKTDVMGAMSHPELGDIDFLWGNSPKDGFQKILARHGEQSARDVPEVIANGKVGEPYFTEQGRPRVQITYGPKQVVLSPERGADPGRWVVTSYDIYDK